MIHEKESSFDTESFLKENNIKFTGDCLTLFKILYSGAKLSGYDVVIKYGMDSRRLREIFTARPDIVRKEWVLNEHGKRKYVQYFVNIPKPPTKAEVQKFWNDYQKEGAPIRFIQQPLF